MSNRWEQWRICRTNGNRQMRNQSIGWLMWISVSWLGCTSNPPAPKQYPIGFTPFPYSTTSLTEVMDFVYGKIKTDGNLVAHHFDDGLPWAEALADAPFPSTVTTDWAFRKEHTPAGHQVYVSITPIHLSRIGLASNKNELGGNQPLSAPWSSYTFNTPQVKTAYLNYAKRIVAYFNPQFLAIGIESNLLKINQPGEWSNYIELNHFVYTELKKLYPALPIFVSVTGFDLAGYTGANATDQQSALRDLLADSDYFGLSLHPQLSSFLANEVPSETVLQSILSLSNKPIAICETSYPAQEATLLGGTVVYNGSATKQKQFFQNLFAVCAFHDTRFMVNFIVRDYDLLWQQIGSPDDFNKIWRDTGFYDENGTEREVMQVWRGHRF